MNIESSGLRKNHLIYRIYEIEIENAEKASHGIHTTHSKIRLKFNGIRFVFSVYAIYGLRWSL